MEKVFIYINLTKVVYNMRLTTSLRTWSSDPLHHAPTSYTSSSPLQFSVGKWKKACNGGKRNYGSNSQCGSKILGQRGNTKIGRVFMLRVGMGPQPLIL
jgi:hypothetical protein